MKIEIGRMTMGAESVIEFKRSLEAKTFACLLCNDYEDCKQKITVEILGKNEKRAQTCVGYIEGDLVGGESCKLSA